MCSVLAKARACTIRGRIIFAVLAKPPQHVGGSLRVIPSIVLVAAWRARAWHLGSGLNFFPTYGCVRVNNCRWCQGIQISLEEFYLHCRHFSPCAGAFDSESSNGCQSNSLESDLKSPAINLSQYATYLPWE